MLCVLCLIVLWGFSLVTSYSGVKDEIGGNTKIEKETSQKLRHLFRWLIGTGKVNEGIRVAHCKTAQRESVGEPVH